MQSAIYLEGRFLNLNFQFFSMKSLIQVQSNPVKGDKFNLEFSEIVPINGTLYNGNIGKNNHFILNFFEIVPFNRFRLYSI